MNGCGEHSKNKGFKDLQYYEAYSIWWIISSPISSKSAFEIRGNKLVVGKMKVVSTNLLTFTSSNKLSFILDFVNVHELTIG